MFVSTRSSLSLCTRGPTPLIVHGKPRGVPKLIVHGKPRGVPKLIAHGKPRGVPKLIAHGKPRGVPKLIAHGKPRGGGISALLGAQLKSIRVELVPRSRYVVTVHTVASIVNFIAGQRSSYCKGINCLKRHAKIRATFKIG